MADASPGAKRAVHPYAVLATCCLSLFLVTMDVTIVNVALSAIRRDLHASVAGLQWAVDGYTVVVASFLMLAGSTADRLGRKRVFQTGLVLFSLGSLACSLAPTTFALVCCRVCQALGGAMLNPVAMSIITNTFIEPKSRARAIGIWGGVVGISMALGPLVGGFLTEAIGWRSIFWVNVPIGILAVFLTARFIPESRAPKARRPDVFGQALVVIALGSLTSSLIEGPRAGWRSPLIVGAITLSVAAIVTLVVYERRRHEPLIDLRFFRSIPLSCATIVAVLAFAAFSASLFIDSLYLQEARSIRASRAGLILLPTALAMFVCSPISGRLVAAGKARIATVGAGLAMTTSAFLLTTLEVDTPMPKLVVAFAVFGIGLGLVNAPITNTAVSGMPRAQAGVASALAGTSRQVGATLGVAIAGTVMGGRGSKLGAVFATATHPIWWAFVGTGSAIVVLGFVSTNARARKSVEALGDLVDRD